MILEENHSVVDGLEEWVVTFDIFMRFSKYWTDRNVADKYYADINVWTLGGILAKVGVRYQDIKETGIIIVANGKFECTIFSSSCDASWKFSRCVWFPQKSHNE